MAEISQVVKDALYEHASYDFDFNEYGEDIAELFNVDFDALNAWWRDFLGLEGYHE
jgi:hypothetical protein